jgi:hypothetical protein
MAFSPSTNDSAEVGLVIKPSGSLLWLVPLRWLCGFTRSGTPLTYWRWLRRASICLGRWTRQGKLEGGDEFRAVTSVLKAIVQLRSSTIALIAERLVHNNQIYNPHAAPCGVTLEVNDSIVLKKVAALLKPRTDKCDALLLGCIEQNRGVHQAFVLPAHLIEAPNPHLRCPIDLESKSKINSELKNTNDFTSHA